MANATEFISADRYLSSLDAGGHNPRLILKETILVSIRVTCGIGMSGSD
jgi:hypothetical protein